jgi:hypothetical protein
VSASLAAPSHLHPTEHSTSLAGPASLGWNVANLGVATIQPQLGNSLEMNLQTSEKPNGAELSKLTVPVIGRYEIA